MSARQLVDYARLQGDVRRATITSLGMSEDEFTLQLADAGYAPDGTPLPHSYAPPPDDEHQAATPPLVALDWHQLFAEPDNDDWILEPLVAARRGVAIYSAAKIGKSLLALELAVALTRGEPFLDRTPSRAVRVLYVDLENDPRGDVRVRLRCMGYGPDHLAGLFYVSFPTMATLDSHHGGRQLVTTAQHYGCEVVIIDTVSRTIAGEESANDTWLNYYRHTGLPAKQAGLAVIRLDHSGKDAGKGARGGSAKSGDVDMVWQLKGNEPGSRNLSLVCEASRVLIDEHKIDIDRRTEPRLRHVRIGSDDQQILDLIAKAEQLQLPIDAGRSQVARALREHGHTARNDVFAEVVRRRKEAGKAVPNPGDRP